MMNRIRTAVTSALDRHLSGETMNYKQIIALFLPILVDQLFIVGLNLVNTAMISSSGVSAVSAVNMVDSLNLFLINVFVAVATGGTVVAAQYKGSGNGLMVSKAAASSVASVTLLAPTTRRRSAFLLSPCTIRCCGCCSAPRRTRCWTTPKYT